MTLYNHIILCTDTIPETHTNYDIITYLSDSSAVSFPNMFRYTF